MTQGLGELLRRGADTVPVPHIDLEDLVVEAGRRRRRRRFATVVVAGTVVVSAIVAVSVLTRGPASETDSPLPADTPSPVATTPVDARGSRPLVYADGATVHVGDKSVEAGKPVAFIAPTDDGAVYEAMLDGTLWFTDGTTTEVIGTSGYTAAPTSHDGVVVTGSSGSLVAWVDMSRTGTTASTELVVYDTSRREEVARLRLPGPERSDVTYVGDDEVWFEGNAGIDRHVSRYDVRAGTRSRLDRSDLDALLDAEPRVFTAVAPDGRVLHGPPSFSERGTQLVAGIYDESTDSDVTPVTLPDGSQLRLRLPPGYVGPWPADEAPALEVSQWLDDDHVVLWADDGGGDLPAKHGDFLECRLPQGVCQITVPRTSSRFVAPYLDGRVVRSHLLP